VDECASSPCSHGNCTDLVDDFNCSCSAGWEFDIRKVEIRKSSGILMVFPLLLLIFIIHGKLSVAIQS
jgi:EGF-like domain